MVSDMLTSFPRSSLRCRRSHACSETSPYRHLPGIKENYCYTTRKRNRGSALHAASRADCGRAWGGVAGSGTAQRGLMSGVSAGGHFILLGTNYDFSAGLFTRLERLLHFPRPRTSTASTGLSAAGFSSCQKNSAARH